MIRGYGCECRGGYRVCGCDVDVDADVNVDVDMYVDFDGWFVDVVRGYEYGCVCGCR